jgi:hypothetical protein
MYDGIRRNAVSSTQETQRHKLYSARTAVSVAAANMGNNTDRHAKYRSMFDPLPDIAQYIAIPDSACSKQDSLSGTFESVHSDSYQDKNGEQADHHAESD